MKNLNFKLKNPIKNKLVLYRNEKIVEQIKPLNIQSILIIGQNDYLLKELKKNKKIVALQTVNATENKLDIKSGSFDLAICINAMNKENKVIYREAIRISKKYILVSLITNISSLMKNNKVESLLKVKGVKIVSRKLILNRFLIVLHK